MPPAGPRPIRCPYCRSEKLRADPVSKSGFSWHRCLQCGERFTARVEARPRPVMKAGLKPREPKRKGSNSR